jgi:hypothetical protein
VQPLTGCSGRQRLPRLIAVSTPHWAGADLAAFQPVQGDAESFRSPRAFAYATGTAWPVVQRNAARRMPLRMQQWCLVSSGYRRLAHLLNDASCHTGEIHPPGLASLCRITSTGGEYPPRPSRLSRTSPDDPYGTCGPSTPGREPPKDPKAQSCVVFVATAPLSQARRLLLHDGVRVGDPLVNPMKPGVKLGGGSEVVVSHRGRRGQRRGVYRAAVS